MKNKMKRVIAGVVALALLTMSGLALPAVAAEEVEDEAILTYDDATLLGDEEAEDITEDSEEEEADIEEDNDATEDSADEEEGGTMKK